jgi:hypothetical protein
MPVPVDFGSQTRTKRARFYGIGIYRVDDVAHMRRLLADGPAREILEFEMSRPFA